MDVYCSVDWDILEYTPERETKVLAACEKANDYENALRQRVEAGETCTTCGQLLQLLSQGLTCNNSLCGSTPQKSEMI